MVDNKFPQYNILGVRVDALIVPELHKAIEKYIESGDHALVLNVNINCLNLTIDNPWLRDLLNGAEIVFCDGAGVRLGGRILGYDIPPRITYANWMWQLAEFAESRGYTFYFLGARPGIAEKAAAALQAHHPALQITGIQHGYFDQQLGSEDNENTIRAINNVKPNILVLGLGMPRQEKWLMENWDRIDANIALTGGAVFDYLSGELNRPPRWMTENGLEWLGRLLIEPHRLWQRYLVGNPLFFWRIFKQRIRSLTQVKRNSIDHSRN